MPRAQVVSCIKASKPDSLYRKWLTGGTATTASPAPQYVEVLKGICSARIAEGLSSRTEEERERLMGDLWHRCQDLLVAVEPGPWLEAEVLLLHARKKG
jgi:hypothetical protein